MTRTVGSPSGPAPACARAAADGAELRVCCRWCPAHGGKSVVQQTLRQHQPGQLVIDVGAYDGQEAIQYARAGHKVLSFEPTPSKAIKIKQALGAF